MNLPTSETQPDGLHSGPSLRKDQESLPSRDSSESDRRGYLFALTNRTKGTAEHHTWLLVSSAVLLFALIFNSSLLVVIAALVAPFLGPLMGPALAAATPSWGKFGRSLVNLLITLLAYFAAGWLAGMIPTANGYLALPHIHLLRSTSLEWWVLIIASGLTTWFFLHNSEHARLSSTLLTYLIFFPAALAGMLYQRSPDQTWLAVMLIVTARLGAALVITGFVFWLQGLAPIKSHGWVMAVATTVLALSAIGAFSTSKFILTSSSSTTQTPITPLVTETSAPTKSHASPTAPLSTPTVRETATPTKSPTLTPTSTITPVSAKVISANGVIVRWQPDKKAEVLTYLNLDGTVFLLGEQAVVGTDIWEKVMVGEGEIGWIMGRFLVTSTPKP